MEEFSDVWRRRQACERCRKHKVRCEYAGPQDEACIRCVRSGAECITRLPPKRKDGRSGSSLGGHAVLKNGTDYDPPVHAAARGSGDDNPMDTSRSSTRQAPSHPVMPGRLPNSPPPSSNDLSQSPLGPNDQSRGPQQRSNSNSTGSVMTPTTSAVSGSGGPSTKRDYFRLDMASKSTPLEMAMEDGLYTEQEVNDLYNIFISSTPPLCPTFLLESTIAEVDRKSPIFAICLITATGLCYSSQKGRERLEVVDNFFATGFAGSQVSVDSLMGYLVLCVFCLPYGERGLSRLYILHSQISALSQKNGLLPGLVDTPLSGFSQSPQEQIQLLRQYTTSCMVGYTICSPYGAVKDVLDSSLPLVNLIPMDGAGDGHTEFLTSVYQIYRMNLDALKVTTCFNDAVTQCTNAMQQFYLAESILQSSPPAFAQVATLKMFRMTFLWIMLGMNVENKAPMNEMMTQAISIGANFADFFSKVGAGSSGPMLPAFGLYCNEDFLVSLWIMRFLSFAAGLDVDIPVTDIIEHVRDRWQHMMQSSYTARQSFGAMFTVTDMMSFQIGELTGKRVTGPGSLDEWSIFKMGFDGEVIGRVNLTRNQLISLLKSEDPLAGQDPGLDAASEASILSVLSRMMRGVVYNSR